MAPHRGSRASRPEPPRSCYQDKDEGLPLVMVRAELGLVWEVRVEVAAPSSGSHTPCTC